VLDNVYCLISTSKVDLMTEKGRQHIGWQIGRIGCQVDPLQSPLVVMQEQCENCEKITGGWQIWGGRRRGEAWGRGVPIPNRVGAWGGGWGTSRSINWGLII